MSTQARNARERSPLARHTPRETEVLGLMAAGLSNGALAERLALSERAVEKHITAVYGAVLLYLSATSDG